MTIRNFELKYGKASKSIALDEDKVLQVLESKQQEPIGDIRQAVLEAVRNPVGTKPLHELVNPGDKVCIVVSDITRAWSKTCEYLPPVIEELNNNGIPDADIFVIVAGGTHRSNTDEEIKIILGDDLAQRLQVYAHDAYSDVDNIYLGTTSRGTEVYLDKRAVEADKVILTGGLTPHLFAGFGGGRKSVMPGIAGVKTINHNHLLALADVQGEGINKETCLGRVEGNRVNEDMCEVCAFLNPCFLINSVMDAQGNFAAIFAGHWYDAWYAGTQFVIRQQGVPACGKSDIVIASGGGFPMDMNLYQGMKAYVPAVMTLKEHGVMIVTLECEDIAEPPIFFDCFRYDDLKEMEQAVRDNFSIPFYVAFYMCCLAAQYTIILVTKEENFTQAAKTGAIPAASLAEAMQMAEEVLRQQGKEDYTVTVIPYGFTTIPLFADNKTGV